MLAAVSKLMGQHNQETDSGIMNRFEKLKSKRASQLDEIKKETLIDKIRPQDRYQAEQELHAEIRSHYQTILLEACTQERKAKQPAYWDGNWGV